jgi:hypothetical protein
MLLEQSAVLRGFQWPYLSEYDVQRELGRWNGR